VPGPPDYIRLMSAASDDVVAEVARAVDAALPALTTEMTDWFVEVIPEFRHDETVRKLMVASTSANLVAIVDMLVHAIPIDRITVPPAAAEYARRFAQHDLSLEGLLRAYRLGEHRFLQWSLAAVGELKVRDTTVALAAIADVSERVGNYIDLIIEGLIDIYETERRRWNSRTGAARAAQIRLVLESDGLGEDAAESLLGWSLGGWHQAAVVWLPSDQPSALQAGARLLAEVSGRGTPLTMLDDDRTLWAWLTHHSPFAVDPGQLRAQAESSSPLRIALGAPAPGLAGFRGTLREARRARAVAETGGAHLGTVVSFDNVAVTALLTRDKEDLRRWVDRVLPGLIGDETATRQLRDTLRVFLELGGSYTQAAARLHLHKNTVHYRVRKAEDLLGGSITDNRLTVEVALLTAELLL
jgi:DNA-binding PucR family transcriptional regulator